MIKMISNHVLVAPDPTDTITLKNGLILKTVSMYERTWYQASSGIVKAIPESLNYDPDPYDNKSALRYDTDMELQVDDHIIFHYNEVVKVHGDPRSRVVGNNMVHEDAIAIKYDSIYCAIRNGEVIPVNGWIIAEALQTDIKFGSLIVPEYLAEKKSKTRCKVRWIGKQVREVRHRPEVENSVKDIRVGDTVTIPKDFAVELQVAYQQKIERGTVLYRIRPYDIVLNQDADWYKKLLSDARQNIQLREMVI